MLKLLTVTTLLAFMGAGVIGTATAHKKSSLPYSERLSHNIHHTIRATNSCRSKLGRNKIAVRNLYVLQSVQRRRYVLRTWLKRMYACGKELRKYGTQGRVAIDSCTMEIIRREASGFDPNDPSTWRSAATTWNGRGSGAYGVPQALPGKKMASAGRDWATNAWTQIKWMIGYMNDRYGGSCAALAYHNSAGYY